MLSKEGSQGTPAKMTFSKLATGSGCVCIDDYYTQDTNRLFIRKISNRTLKDKGLRTHWERGKRPSPSDCSKECELKGLSFYRSPEGDSIIAQWRSDWQYAQKYSPKRRSQREYSCCVQFKQAAGLIKPTPNRKSRHHFTFYKQDNFSLELIKVVNILPI